MSGWSGPSVERGRGVPWVDVLVSAIAAVSWALIGMAGTAALGLHLLGADTVGSLGPMTAAVVALGAGGSVTPSGDVSVFGLTGAEATTAVEITPLGVSLVGALLLSWFFLRSLRTAGVVIAPAELLARAGTVVALFTATMGGLAWAGHDVITIDGGSLGLDDLPGGGGGGADGGGGGGGGGGVEIPGLGDLGDIGGLLPDRLGDLVDAQAAVGFTVDTSPTLLGGLGWSAGVLLIALLASRRTPLPRGWEAVHRVVRPAVSAVVTVLLVAVAAGFAAAVYAAVGDDHPRRIAGAALLGAPNGVWLGIDLGLFVPWDGRATGALTNVLPDPLDDLLGAGTDQQVTLGRLAELDSRVWLLGVAAAMMMLLAGVLTAVRTPGGSGGAGGRGAVGSRAGGRGASGLGAGGQGAGGRGAGGAGFVGRCALRLGGATALALPLLAWLTDVSVDASLSVLGFDAFGAGVELHGHLGMALLLGAVWGAGAGAAGALLAHATGAAGGRATALARGDGGVGMVTGSAGAPDSGAGAGYAVRAGGGYPVAGPPGAGGERPPYGSGGSAGRGGTSAGDPSGPYAPGAPYRPPNPATNPYLRVPERLREPEDARPRDGGSARGDGFPDTGGPPTAPAGLPAAPAEPPTAPTGPPTDPDGSRSSRPPGGPPSREGLYDAPTMIRPVGSPPPRPPGRRSEERSSDDGPPPPPPPASA